MEILTRVYLGLFAALIFGGLPALFCAAVTLKIVLSRRKGVWVTRKMGRIDRVTLQDHPGRFRTAIRLNTILAVGLGLIAAAVMIWMFLACVLTPTDRTTDAKPDHAVTAPANHEPQTTDVHTAEKLSTDSASPAVSNASADHERIQGRWDYVTLTTGPRDYIVFTKDTITFHVRDKTVAGTFVLDSTTQPKRIDLLFAGKPDGPDSRQGIYQFQGDLLVICLATTAGLRPTKFQSSEKQNHIMLVRPTADSSGSDDRPLSEPAISKQGTAP